MNIKSQLSLAILATVSLIVFAATCSEVLARERPAGSIKINAWEYDRGNTLVSENPGRYGDYRDKHPELMLTGDENEKSSWSVEYDVDFPVDTTYSLRVRYASAGVRPLEVWLDNKRVGKCCLKKTNNAPPYLDRHPNVWEGLPERSWHLHGAEWEDSCTMKVAKGKHTLKFTCNGPPANPIEIVLESPVPFPKGWKPTPRKVDLSRIPIRYRNVFLPADGVNTEALRLAIEDNVNSLGLEYPKGKQYLKQLAQLTKKKLEAAGRSTEQQEAVETELKSLRREAMLANPKLNFDKLLFVKQVYADASTYTFQRTHYKPGSLLIC